MHYDGNIIRPPSEADSIIIQITAGCSHNRCTFCGAYKNKQFRQRNNEEINENIAFAAKYCARQHRVFLADGDALILPQSRLVEIFTQICTRLPQVRRISLYANAKAIRSKTVEQLAELKKLGLNRVYLGLESGDDQVLSAVIKGETADSMLAAARQVKEAGLFLSVTVLLGLAGATRSLIHARETGRVLTQMAPNQIAALMFMPIPGTELGDKVLAGVFQLPDSHGLLEELRELLVHTNCDRVQFMANHASNYLPITGRLSRNKNEMLQLIDQALTGRVILRAESMRAL